MDYKEIELFYIKEFLKLTKYQIIGYKPSESPDSIFTIKYPGQTRTRVVGIEKTDYYNDATPGQASPGQLLYDFWGEITVIIESRINEDSEFHQINGYFKLNKEKLKLKAESITSKQEAIDLTSAIADELCSLVGEFLRSGKQECSYYTSQQVIDKMPSVSDVYEKLNEYFFQIDLQKVDFWESIRYGWRANVNAAHIGLSASKLTEIVHSKKDRRRAYNADNIEEIWLLIAAPATTVYNATPNIPGIMSSFEDTDLLNVCESSGFGKVFFWSRKPPEWYKQIWPNDLSYGL